MKFEEADRGDRVVGQTIYRKDPDTDDLHTVRISSDHQRFYFIFKDFTYVITLRDLIKEAKTQAKQRKKSTKKVE